MKISYTDQYLAESSRVLNQIEARAVEKIFHLLIALKERQGRLFFLGTGGGAANASHAVNDFRKIAGIEAYAPTDNVSELTARINDEGWESAYANWLEASRISSRDMIFIFSVGGGDSERKISVNLVRALDYAKEVGATICGVVGRDGGYTAKMADACLIPVMNPETVTPHTESFQALILHLLVSHPGLRRTKMKWESIQ
jgi:D-sedoheptulose 7-phosphate isomerase